MNRAYQPPPPPVDPWPKVPAAKPPPEPDWDDEIALQKEPEKPAKVINCFFIFCALNPDIWPFVLLFVGVYFPSSPKKDTSEPKIEPKSSEQDDESNIDLDTRIAMMFKEKSFGAAPPFLQLDDDSEEEAEKEDRTAEAAGGSAAVGTTDTSLLEKIKTEMNVENSMDSMMHMANEAISNDSISMKSNSADGVKIKVEKKIIEDGASDISSDDEVLESCSPPPLPPGGGSKASTVPPPPPHTTATMAGDIKLEDDKMSLSSLSSTEEKSNNRSKAIAATDVDPHKNVVPSMPGYYYPPTGLNHPYYYPNGDNATMYDPYSGYMQPYMGGFPPTIIPGSYVQSTEYPTTATAKQQPHGAAASNEQIAAITEPKKDPSERIVAAVIERVKTELKQILKKDFNKRMIESIAFKKYEAWWDEQVQKKSKPTTPAV